MKREILSLKVACYFNTGSNNFHFPASIDYTVYKPRSGQALNLRPGEMILIVEKTGGMTQWQENSRQSLLGLIQNWV